MSGVASVESTDGNIALLDSRAGQVKLAFCSNVGRAPTPEPGDAEREVLTGCLPTK
jgi:hypothetical protein